MKKRRLEILKLLLTEFEKNRDYRCGICGVIVYRLEFFIDNRIVLKQFYDWFQKQRPHSRFHSKFTKHVTFIDGGYWWVRTEEGYNQRVLFLKHLIEKQSK